MSTSVIEYRGSTRSRSRTRIGTKFINYEISSPSKGISHKEFNRKYPRLTFENYPEYHRTLQKLHCDDLSWRINRCGIDGMRLDCTEDIEHSCWVKLGCNRRTCPQCATIEMFDRFRQFFEIAGITANASHDDMFDPGWRVRFWTLSCKAVKNYALDFPLKAMKRSLFAWWRQTHGERSKEFNYNYERAGGLFVFEVQSGWNVHIHGLILGPHFSDDQQQKNRVGSLTRAREIWTNCLTKYGWSGHGLNVKPVIRKDGDFRGSILETIAYPLRPDKEGKFQQRLLAYVESAFSGQRRYILKGSWYNQFSRIKRTAICPECLNELYKEPAYDIVWAYPYRKNMFYEDEEGLQRWINRGYRFPIGVFRQMEREDRFKSIPKVGDIL